MILVNTEEQKFVITIYGKSKDNKNVVLNVVDFEPFFYVRIPKNWNINTVRMFFGKTGSHKLHTKVGVRMNTVEKSEDISEESMESEYDENYVNIEI